MPDEMSPQAPDARPSLEELDRRLKERELKLKEVEIAAKQREVGTSQWLNPVVLGLFAAAIALIGNVIVAWVNNYNTQKVARVNNDNTQKVEHLHAQSTLILEAIKTNGDTASACKNLTFFVNVGLLDDANKTIIGACPKETQGVPTLPFSNLRFKDNGDIVVVADTPVSVLVEDNQRKPISGAIVRINGITTCKTPNNGQCEFESAAFGAQLAVSVVKEGYVGRQTQEIWKNVPIVIVLQKE